MGGEIRQGSFAGRRAASLIERERDLEVIAEAVAGPPAGRAALAVIEGPAGIGKTRLLAEGRRLANDAGARTLAARASELEGELAFGVVRQLFEGAVGLEGLEPLESAGAAATTDVSFAMLHALYTLTVALASGSPLVIAVDDLHWCDEPSLRFLNYLVRRLEGLAVTLLCTVRPRERRARSPLVTELVGDPLARLVRPGPLSSEGTSRLVADGLGEGVDQTFSTACHTATGGNPLLLRELISTLQIEGVTPDAGHVWAVSNLGAQAVSRAVLVRLGRLSGDALALARSASVMQTGADLPFLAELAGLEQDDAAAAASALVAAEILRNGADAAFAHPLVGAAVYEDFPAPERSAAHERAARQLRERGVSAGTVAVHLALAPARGEEWVCDVLRDAARESLRAGAPAGSVRYLARALAEPPPPEHRARLLLELGGAEATLYAPSAVEHLTEAFEQAGDVDARSAAAVTLARTLLLYNRPDECISLIRRASAELKPGSDVRLALEALRLMAAAYGTGRPGTPVHFERPPVCGAGAGAKMLAAVVSRQLAFGGGSAEECTQLALAALDGGDLLAADTAFLSITAILTLVRADRREADEHWEQARLEWQTRGSLAAKAGGSMWHGYACLRRGELDAAEESLQSSREEFRLLGLGDLPDVPRAAFLSAALRERGDLVGARRMLESVDAPRDASDIARYWLDGLAELLLAEERFGEAYVVATDLERRFASLANPIDTPARSHRAVALYHLGREEQGLALAAESLALARRWGAPGGLARALRVLGTLEGEEGLDHLRDAVQVAEGSVARLEFAKALVALGAELRRSSRPTDARDPLRRGFELAVELGAEGLAARARRELRAVGARPRTAALGGPGALTPAERRVAARAAAGQTNPAIAQALFVTPKTVESHLSNAYRKLGVRSRRELRGKLDAPTADP